MRPILQPLQPTHAAPRLAPHRARTIATAAAVVLAAFATLSVSPSTAPASPLAQRQAQAAQLDREVRSLERRYDDLQERHRGALLEHERILDEVREARREVASTRKGLRSARTRLTTRAAAVYRAGGSGSQLLELTRSGTLTSFFDRIETVRRVGDQDASVLDRVQELNRRVEAKQRVLRTARTRAAASLARAERDEARMERLLATRQAKLDSVNGEVRAILDARRRAAEAAAAARARAEAPRVVSSARSSSDDRGASPSAKPASSGLSVPLPPGSGQAAAAANAAMTRLGMPYVWAASGPSSFDCSGLVTWAFAQAGRPGLPHSTYSLINMGVEVPMDQLQVGDLVFSGSLGHMGIYIGGGNFVHAPRTGDVVKVTSMSDYRLARARRL